MPKAFNTMSAAERERISGSPDKLDADYETGLGRDTAPGRARLPAQRGGAEDLPTSCERSAST
jgi:hypothetical protein